MSGKKNGIGDLIEDFQKGLSLKRKKNAELFSYAEGEFEQAIWKEFLPANALSLLANPSPSYFAHKETVFVGLCTWALEPSNTRLRKAAMVHEMLRILDADERRVLRLVANDSFLAHMAGVYARGPEFYEELFIPTRGLRGSTGLPSRGYVKNRLASKRPELFDAIDFLSILHFHVSNLSEFKEYGVPSVKKGSELFKRLGFAGGAISASTVKSRWREWKSTISLTYAARSVYADSGKTLLDEMLAGTARYSRWEGLIPTWLQRARFVAEDILGRIRDVDGNHPGALDLNLPYFSDLNLQAEVFECPDFSPEQVNAIKAKFPDQRYKKARALVGNLVSPAIT